MKQRSGREIQWDIFLTLHYKPRYYYLDSEAAETKRRLLIATLIREAKERLGLSNHDLQYFGTTEKRAGRCHTHTLIYVKKKAGDIACLVRNTIWEFIPWDIVMLPGESTPGKTIQLVKKPEAVAAYLSKLNRNELDFQRVHQSRGFVTFVENHKNYNL